MSDTVFMVMPFSDEIAESAYKHSTKPIVESFNFKIYRADEIFSVNPIFDDIVTAIEQSSIVIVDISGKNANCCYELGISHTLKRNRTIMITHDRYDDVPFDIAHFRILNYENSIKGIALYQDNLMKTLKSITSGLPDLYRGEFDTTIDILEGLQEFHALYTLMGLSKISKPIGPDSDIIIEGHYKDKEPMGATCSGRDHLNPFLRRKYVEIVGDIYTLTSKGQAFVDYLNYKGYKVDALNYEIFTEGYVSKFEVLKGKEM